MKKCFFTLMELLIVMMIIAILASMLLPALKTATDKAKSVYCMSNMRSFAQEMIAYTSNFNDYYMPYDVAMNGWASGSPETNWFNALCGTESDRPATIYPEEAKLFKKLVTCKAIRSAPGKRFDNQHFAYNNNNNGIYKSGVWKYIYIKYPQIQNASRSILMSESERLAVWMEDYFLSIPSYYNVIRHGSGITVFWDGHAKQLNLSWHIQNKSQTNWNVAKP